MPLHGTGRRVVGLGGESLQPGFTGIPDGRPAGGGGRLPAGRYWWEYKTLPATGTFAIRIWPEADSVM